MPQNSKEGEQMKVFHRIIVYEEVKDEAKLAERTQILLGLLKGYGVSEYLLTVVKDEPENIPKEQIG